MSLIDPLQIIGASPPLLTTNEIGQPNAIMTVNPTTLGGIFGVFLFIAGIVAMISIIVGGIRYVTANGDSSQIQSAKNTITYAVIGLVVVMMASAITGFVTANIK